jgi:hypothetical protein
MIDLGIVHRGVQRSVPKHVGHLLDRAALVDDPTGDGVAQRMATSMLDAHTSEGIADDASDGVRADGFVMRRQASHEHCCVAGLGSFVTQVGLQGSACDHRQGQQILATGLRALERDGAQAPVDASQLQPTDLDAAQAQVERQADDGITAPGRRQHIGERVQQPFDFLGLQASGQRGDAPVRR